MSEKLKPKYEDWAESMAGRDLEPEDWNLELRNPSGVQFLLSELIREAYYAGFSRREIEQD